MSQTSTIFWRGDLYPNDMRWYLVDFSYNFQKCGKWARSISMSGEIGTFCHVKLVKVALSCAKLYYIIGYKLNLLFCICFIAGKFDFSYTSTACCKWTWKRQIIGKQNKDRMCSRLWNQVSSRSSNRFGDIPEQWTEPLLQRYKWYLQNTTIPKVTK